MVFVGSHPGMPGTAVHPGRMWLKMLHNASYLSVYASFFHYDALCNSRVSAGNSFFLTEDFASSNHASNFPIS
jgi:hypothetical protein